MLQALIWFVFFLFTIFFMPMIFTAYWLLVEVIVFLWPYAMGVK